MRALSYFAWTLIAGGLVVAGVGGGTWHYQHRLVESEWKLRNKVVACYLDGELGSGSDGVIRLPDHLASDSLRYVWVTKREDEQFLLFPSWLEQGGTMEAFVYSTAATEQIDQESLRVRPLATVSRHSPVDSIGGGWYRVCGVME